MADQISPVPSLDMSTLTPKQQEMALARNPMSGNQQNQLLQDQKAQNRQLDEQRKGLASAGQVQKQMAVPTQAQSQAGSAAAGSMQRNLTTFSNRLAAKVGNIVSGADVSQLGLDLPEDTQPVWNPETGQFEVPDVTDVGYDVSRMAEAKKAQIAALQEEMSPYFSYDKMGDQTLVTAKSFEDVLKQYADLDNDGQLSPEETKYMNESFQIAQMLKRLNETNPYSSEAAALRMQLELMDKEGLVSGIQRALDQYERLAGKERKGAEFYGDIGQDALNLETIVNMTTDKIENEIIKAITGQQSVFGQDFESAITQNRLRSDLAKSRAFDVQTRNALVNATRDWATDIETTMSDYADKINDGFKSVATDKIPQYFEQYRKELLARGESAEGLDAAIQWFDDLTQAKGKNDISTALMELLTDPNSGLAANQRQAISQWIGAVTGDKGLAESSLLAGVVNSLNQKGFIDVQITNEQGQPENAIVEFSDRDRLAIARILNNASLTDEEKRSQINNMVNNKIQERISAVGDISAVRKYFEEGNFDTGLDVFVESLVKSLSTYQKSATEHLYNQIMSTRGGEFAQGVPEGGDPRDYVDPKFLESIQGMGSSLTKQFAQNMQNIEQTLIPYVDRTVNQANADLVNLDRIESEIKRNLEGAPLSMAVNINNVAQSNGFTRYGEYLVQGFSNYLANQGGNPAAIDWGQFEPYTKAFTMLSNLGFMMRNDPKFQRAVANLTGKLNPSIVNMLKDPSVFLKTYNPIQSGKLSLGTIDYAKSLSSTLSKYIEMIANAEFESSEFNLLAQGQLKSIAADRQRAQEHLKAAEDYKTTISDYANTARKVVNNFVTFSPDEVASLAMQMARQAESGNVPSFIDFLDMSKIDINKEEFEKVRAGDYGIRPTYKPTAVMDAAEIPTYETLQAPTELPELMMFARNSEAAAPTPPPAVLGQLILGGGEAGSVNEPFVDTSPRPKDPMLDWGRLELGPTDPNAFQGEIQRRVQAGYQKFVDGGYRLSGIAGTGDTVAKRILSDAIAAVVQDPALVLMNYRELASASKSPMKDIRVAMLKGLETQLPNYTDAQLTTLNTSGIPQLKNLVKKEMANRALKQVGLGR